MSRFRHQFPKGPIMTIAEMCDIPTKAALCRLNRSLYVPLQRVLCRNIEIRHSQQLEAFARYVTKAENHLWTRSTLACVKRFEYCPSIRCATMADLGEKGTLFKLSQIPTDTLNVELLFPKLKRSKLIIDATDRVNPRYRRHSPPLAHQEGRTCFLSEIRFLWLAELIGHTSSDIAPALQMLGIRNVETVKITFTRKLPISSAVAFYLRNQHSLKTIILDLQGHLADLQATPYIQDPGLLLDRYSSTVERELIQGFWRGRCSYPNLQALVLQFSDEQWREVAGHLESQIFGGLSSQPFKAD